VKVLTVFGTRPEAIKGPGRSLHWRPARRSSPVVCLTASMRTAADPRFFSGLNRGFMIWRYMQPGGDSSMVTTAVLGGVPTGSSPPNGLTGSWCTATPHGCCGGARAF